jgi:hypothetical protein
VHIDELKQVDRGAWDREFAALSARVATEEIYVQVWFRYGRLRARAFQLQDDGTTIHARLYPQSPTDKPDDGIHLARPETEDGMYHSLTLKTGEQILTMGFHLCSHGEFGEFQIATDPALFELTDSYALEN